MEHPHALQGKEPRTETTDTNMLTDTALYLKSTCTMRTSIYVVGSSARLVIEGLQVRIPA